MAVPAVVALGGFRVDDARVVVVVERDALATRLVLAAPDTIDVVGRADHPLSIFEVEQTVSSLVALADRGFRIVISCPDRLEEAELVGGCLAAVLGSPVHSVVAELGRLAWIDVESYDELLTDFVDFWKCRGRAA